MRTVKCSLCGRTLDPIGSFIDRVKRSGAVVIGEDDRDSWQQWMGTVCSNCKIVFCSECRDTGPGPCPRCGENVHPATAYFLPRS